MTASTEPAEWVASRYPHLPIDMENQFHLDAIALLSSIGGGPHGVYGSPLRTVAKFDLLCGERGLFGPPPTDDEIECRLLAAPACPWEVTADQVSVACTNELGNTFVADASEWPGYARIRGVIHVSEIPDYEWSEPGFIGAASPVAGFAFAMTDGRVYADHAYTEVSLWRR